MRNCAGSAENGDKHNAIALCRWARKVHRTLMYTYPIYKRVLESCGCAFPWRIRGRGWYVSGFWCRSHFPLAPPSPPAGSTLWCFVAHFPPALLCSKVRKYGFRSICPPECQLVRADQMNALSGITLPYLSHDLLSLLNLMLLSCASIKTLPEEPLLLYHPFSRRVIDVFHFCCCVA